MVIGVIGGVFSAKLFMVWLFLYYFVVDSEIIVGRNSYLERADSFMTALRIYRYLQNIGRIG